MKPLIVIAGPTACGKTAASIELAKRVNGEIISADSMQVYKYMDIGTAKITKSEQQNIRHYLIDELYPNEEYSVAVFQRKAKQYAEKIYKEKKVPILVGGTGFYINAFVNDNNFTETHIDYEYRVKLEKLAENEGPLKLFEMLRIVDPNSCKTIHYNNVKKVIRALEYFKQIGEPISKHNLIEKKRKSPYDVIFVVLSMERKILYERIDKRIDIMIEKGLIDEVRNLLKNYSTDLVSMQGLGYKEIAAALNGKISMEEAIYILKRDTRHFAKRQMTWFKNQCKDALFIDVNKVGGISNSVDIIESEYKKLYL